MATGTRGPTHGEIHALVLRRIVESGRAPTIDEISVDRARTLFARYGLDGPIWTLPGSDDRF